MEKYSFILGLFLSVLFVVCPTASRAEGSDDIDVMIVSTYSPYYRWSSRVSEVIVDHTIKKLGKTASTVNISLETLKSGAKVDSLYSEFGAYLVKRDPELIVLVGSSSFVLAPKIGEWCPEASMLLIGGQNTTAENLDKLPPGDMKKTSDSLKGDSDNGLNVTYQSMPVFLEDEVNLILHLMPGLRTIHYIGGNDPFSVARRKDLEELIGNYDDLQLDVMENGSITTEELFDRINTLNKDEDAIIYSSWLSAQISKVEPLLTNHLVFLLNDSPVPVFLLRDNGWIAENEMVLGGFVLDEERYFKDLRGILTRILNGTEARDIDMVACSEPVVLLSYPALMRYGIEKERWPSYAKIVNRPEGNLARYKTLFVTLAFLLLALITLFVTSLYAKQRKINDMSGRYQNVVNNAPALFCRAQLVYDSWGDITDLIPLSGNKAFTNILHQYKLNINTTSLLTAMPESGGKVIETISKAKDVGDMVLKMDHNVTELDAYYQIEAVFEGEDIIHMLVFDVTDLHRIQTELEVAKAKAEKSDMIKTQFVQNMSHEIRTPLNAIMGFSQLLALPEGSNTQEERKNYAQYIKNNSNMLMMLIDDILDLGDLTSGNYKINLEKVHCNDLCRMAMRTVEYRVPAGVNLYFTTTLSEDYLLETDPRRVQQVLVNYLSNACKHTKKGSIHIHCSDTENPGRITFSVTDTGTGVPPEMAENIFERFSKLDAFIQGTGLGLNICRTVANCLGGSVYLDTSYTDGARFIFIL